MPHILGWYSVWERLGRAGYLKLFAFQYKAVYAFRDGKDIFVKAPTGAGKTLIPLICATLILGMKKRCVFLVPTRRLIDQTYDRLKDWFESIPHCEEEYNIVTLTGDNRPSYKEIREVHIIITTYESFNGMLAKHYRHSLLNNVGLVAIDEMHYVGDVERGTHLEEAIVKAKLWLRPRPQMIYLAATLGNIQEIGEWLKATVIETKKRKSEIIVGSPINVYNEDERLKVIAQLVKETDQIEIGAKETDKRCVLVFCRSRWHAETRAQNLAKMLEKEGYKKTVSYSHRGLKTVERQKRMKAFQKGEIDVLFTTTEYKEGVNAPVLRVIIADTEVFNSQDIEQMIGRAARPRFFQIGYANLIIQGNIEDILENKRIRIEEGVAHFEESPLESWAKYHLNEIILNRLAKGACSIGRLIRYLKEFYFYFEDTTQIKNWYKVMENAISEREMFMLTADNYMILFSLIDNDDRYNAKDKKNFHSFVTEFLMRSRKCAETQKRRRKRDKKLVLEKKMALVFLKEYLTNKLKRYDAELKTQVKTHLGYLIHIGFLKKQELESKAIKEGLGSAV